MPPDSPSGRRPAGAASPRVLLAHMPMADPIMPNLGIEILAERLRRNGITCDCFYGTLRLPPACSVELVHGMGGYGLFTPAYFDLDVDAYVAEATACIACGTASAPYEPAFPDIAAEIHAGVAAAELCLERCLADIPTDTYDVIGFSIIFDTQKMPALALARALKTREPGLRILFGGTGCDGEMAEAMLEHFPEIDAVLRGDAEDVIASFVAALHHGALTRATIPATAAVRGIAPQAHPADGAVPSLKGRTAPDYRAFVDQWRGSPYRDRPLTLLFEASRGCWWGEKHHCRFCGIRAVTEGYRERDGDAVFEEIMTLHQRHRPDLLYATDAILSREHMRSLLPRLAARRRDGGEVIRLFFEIKSTIGRRDAALMAAAGIVGVQPGIESFATNMLRNTDKGATGIRQIAALKWLGSYGIDTIYGLLVDTPGESAADIAEMIDLIGSIHHLQPPVGVNPLALHRFSPYWRDPERWGIRNIRAYEAQRIAFRAPEPLMRRLCYELAFDSDQRCDPELAARHDDLRAAVAAWQIAFASGERLTLAGSDAAPMIVRRSAGLTTTRLLTPDEHALYRAIAAPVSMPRAAELAGMRPDQAAPMLDDFARSALALAMDGLWIGLAQPAVADAWADAGLDTLFPTACFSPRPPLEIVHGPATAATAHHIGD